LDPGSAPFIKGIGAFFAAILTGLVTGAITVAGTPGVELGESSRARRMVKNADGGSRADGWIGKRLDSAGRSEGG
jgi:hypothetical protein